MQITIFGANGKVGSLVVELALKYGYRVVAFVHSESHFASKPKLVIAQGDIYHKQEVADAIAGSEAVVSALSSWGTPKKDILTTGMRHIIPAMEKRAIKRIISLTGADARAANDHLGVVHKASHALIKVSAGRVIADGENHVKLLEQSDLNWTVVRSPIMNTVGNLEQFILSSKRPMPWATINRHAVAQSMVSLIADTSHHKQAPFIIRK